MTWSRNSFTSSSSYPRKPLLNSLLCISNGVNAILPPPKCFLLFVHFPFRQIYLFSCKSMTTIFVVQLKFAISLFLFSLQSQILWHDHTHELKEYLLLHIQRMCFQHSSNLLLSDLH